MTKNHKHIVLKTKSQITITDEYLKNDSIISTNKVILDDDTSDAFIYTYTKSADNPLKCQTVSSVTKNDTIEMIFEYNDTEKGFVEKASIIEDNEIQNYTESYYIIPDKSPSETTAIRRKTPRTGISSKAKYFDLLGRYKFVK
ncbi:MAG: hypothetical protein MJY82_11200 [Fibrobacter sp.]|nr:hypothetical protein [Fibrobacter sp.]